jgi:predicted solute-binding protein
MQAHINLYVNDYSLSLGNKGREAIRKLLAVGESLQQYPAGTAAHL